MEWCFGLCFDGSQNLRHLEEDALAPDEALVVPVGVEAGFGGWGGLFGVCVRRRLPVVFRKREEKYFFTIQEVIRQSAPRRRRRAAWPVCGRQTQEPFAWIRRPLDPTVGPPAGWVT